MTKRKLHGMTGHELWGIYGSMKQRCYNKNHPKYKRYGGRGIEVCDRWRYNFDLFVEDMGERPKGMSIDRIDNDGNYEPGNCRWTNRTLQQVNRVTAPNVYGYKGIGKSSPNGHYFTIVQMYNTRLRIHKMDTAEEAAAVYDQIVMQVYGESARTNFNWSEEN